MFRLEAIGNIGKDAEKRVTRDGMELYTFNIGVSAGKNKTEWLQVTIKGELGDKIAKYLTKGKKVLVSGLPSVNVYTNRENKTVGTLQVWANTVELLSPANSQDSNGNGDHYNLPETKEKVDDDSIPF